MIGCSSVDRQNQSIWDESLTQLTILSTISVGKLYIFIPPTLYSICLMLDVEVTSLTRILVCKESWYCFPYKRRRPLFVASNPLVNSWHSDYILHMA